MRAVPVLLVALACVAAPLAGCLEKRSPGSGGDYVTVETTKGAFTFQLQPAAAPRTVAHIADLVKRGFYDGVPFHRYEPDFVIQGGDPECRNLTARACGSGGSGTTVPLETSATYKHRFGAVGLARSPPPDTGDSQFYVVIDPEGASFLDGNGSDTQGYCVFGYVVMGMDVVTQLRRGDVMTRVTLSDKPPA